MLFIGWCVYIFAAIVDYTIPHSKYGHMHTYADYASSSSQHIAQSLHSVARTIDLKSHTVPFWHMQHMPSS